MNGVTELLGVIRRGDTKAVGDLLAAHPDLADARDEKGNSPEAAFNGDVALVRLLLDSGADRSLRTGGGQTPLEIAGTQGRHEVARLLNG